MLTVCVCVYTLEIVTSTHWGLTPLVQWVHFHGDRGRHMVWTLQYEFGDLYLSCTHNRTLLNANKPATNNNTTTLSSLITSTLVFLYAICCETGN